MLLLAALAALVLASLAIPASANYRVGICEQDARRCSTSPAWQALKLKRVRYVVAWDYYKDPGQVARSPTFMNARRAPPTRTSWSCSPRAAAATSNGRYSRSSACRAPSTSAYRSAFRRFERAFPWVRTYAPWNEANHVSQPTAKSPKRAAQYYDDRAPRVRLASARSWPPTCSTRAP